MGAHEAKCAYKRLLDDLTDASSDCFQDDDSVVVLIAPHEGPNGESDEVIAFQADFVSMGITVMSDDGKKQSVVLWPKILPLLEVALAQWKKEIEKHA